MGALCLLTGMLVAAHPPSLKKAVALYNDLNDAAAAKELQALLRTELTDDVAGKAHVYLGLIAFNALHTTEARDQFKRALTLDPTLDLPVGVSPKARLAFAEARHQLQLEMAKPVERAAGPPPAPAPAPTQSPKMTASPEPPPPQNPNPSASPPAELVLIPPPAPPAPSDEPLVEEHVKPEPSPTKSHALAITLGSLGLIAGGIAIVGAVEVANYNNTLADARRNPGKYTGNQIASQQNGAQVWQISAITLAVVAGLGLGGAVLAW